MEVRRYQIGKGAGSGKGKDAGMEAIAKTVLGAVLVAALMWTANSLMQTKVTLAEIQRDLTSLGRDIQTTRADNGKELTVVNQRVMDLKSELRDFRNEQRAVPSQGSHGWGRPPVSSNPSLGPQQGGPD